MGSQTVTSVAVTAAGGEPAAKQVRADAARNRERLLEAAAAAFTERGADVPLEDIARGAGVGIGTLYRHFPTREALVEAVYRNEVSMLCARGDELLAEMPPDQALAEWMRLFVQHVATKRGMLSVLKPLMASSSTLSADTKGRAADTASGSKLLSCRITAKTSASAPCPARRPANMALASASL